MPCGAKPDFTYELIRSARRTVSVEVTREETVVVRAPQRMPRAEIEMFLKRHRDWILQKLEHQHRLAQRYPEPDEAEAEELKRRAREYLPQRVAYYAAVMHVEPAWVKITSARKRFGSCGPENGLCFAWRLMRYPAAAIDYVVVHELAHIVHKNHSRAFYGLIAQVLPDYRERAALLKN